MENKKIILGTAQFGAKYGITRENFVSKKSLYKILDNALKNKILHLDTAPGYKNEKLIGEYIRTHGIQKEIKIITKIPKLKKNYKIDIKNNLYKSLENLCVNKFHTIFFHDIRDTNTLKNNKDFFKKLKKDFQVKNFGFSIYEKKQYYRINKINFLNSFQVPLNIINQEFLNVINKKHRFYLRSIFLQGLLLSDKINYSLLNKRLIKSHLNYLNFIKKNKINPLKLCLQFINSIKFCNYYILGVQQSGQLTELLKYKNSRITNKKMIHRIRLLFNSKDSDPRKWVI